LTWGGEILLPRGGMETNKDTENEVEKNDLMSRKESSFTEMGGRKSETERVRGSSGLGAYEGRRRIS